MLNEMRALVLLAEEGSVQGAARRIPLTQPAVTRQIQRLERSLGVVLLDRRQKPPVLTPAGIRAVDRCRAILAAVGDLKAAAISDTPEGVLRVGVIHALADAGFAPIVETLRKRHPRVTLRIAGGWSASLVEDIHRGALDAAVVLGPVDGDPAGVIVEDRFNVVAARRWKLARRHRLADLDAHGWVLSPEPCTARAALAMALNAKGRALRTVAEVQDPSLQLALVAQGLGLGFFPSSYAEHARAAGLHMFDVEDLACPFAIRMERAPDLRQMTPVLDQLQAELQMRLRATAAP